MASTVNKRRGSISVPPLVVGPRASSLAALEDRIVATWMWPVPSVSSITVGPGQDVVFSMFVEPSFAMMGRVEPLAGFTMYVEPLWAGTTIIGD